ncbi:hypothetical protein LSH36_690g04042 [Paralvinella palmiformis]|uniref:N-formylglutamate amidohydrolase n=1 Tax=Paralvinella palmiformis TaxID=53620 RepID=A0AAD9J260_9ANNE|nr:hypothetical protein LSH36_690g04042 [Paralvinella palmiformis]
MWPVFVLSAFFFLCGAKATLVPSPYVDFLPGSLNVILSSPHGGHLKPSSIPNRDAGCYINGDCVYSHTCGTKDPNNCDVVTSNDLYTQELTRELYTSLCNEFNACPPTVINLLHRRKHDPNREKDEGTFGVPDVEQAWDYYHGLLQEIRQNQTDQALLLDIHGHGHPTVWVELGYLVSRTRLNLGYYSAHRTSVRNLYAHTTGVSSIQELLTGAAPISFGALLEAQGYQAVPSPTNHGPGSHSYFSGGYITKHYGSRYSGIVDAIQIESPKAYRKLPERTQYVAALTETIRNYTTRHYV